MKILLVSMRYDYGDPARGECYEFVNFYDSLTRVGHSVKLFDYMEQMQHSGKAKMNAALLDCASQFNPDVAIVSLYTDQLLPETILALRKGTKTLCFFHDDTWRRDFSRFWAPHFDFFTSSDFECVRKYERLGLNHIIHFPFGVNQALYTPMPVEKKYDVSFVGQWGPYRAWLIKRLRQARINVEVAGHRWPRGTLAHADMVRMFNESRINLNLSNSTSWDARYLLSSPYAIYNRIRSKKDVEQLKARHFEICACEAFQLSYYVDGLERCYRIGEEIGVFINPDDLIEKVRYYLANEDLMSQMSHAAYKRTLAEHTYAQRFEQLFARMGFKTGMASE